MRVLFAAALLMTSIAASALADEPAPQKLTLERIFASPNLGGAAPRALKLSPDGKLLTSLRPRPDDRERFDLWGVDTETGEARMLVDSTKFGGGELSEAEKMQRERARTLREQAAKVSATGRAKESRAADAGGATRPVATTATTATATATATASAGPVKPRKLSFKEQRELDELPRRIEALEAEQKTLGALLADAGFYTREPDRSVQAQRRHAQIDDEVVVAMERWELLGSKT